MNSFIYKDKEIKYYVDKGKRKNYYITIRNGEVEFKVPKGTPDSKIESLIFSKRDWIYNHLNKKTIVINKKNEYKNGEIFFVLGKPYILNIKYTDVKKAKINFDQTGFEIILPQILINEENKPIINKLFDKFYFEFAEKTVMPIMNELIIYTGLEPKEVRIRNLKTAWGNCSGKDRICINKDVTKFDENAIRYVCLHELCHLKYLNHSKDFWNLVKKYMPEYKKYEEKLKH